MPSYFSVVAGISPSLTAVLSHFRVSVYSLHSGLWNINNYYKHCTVAEKIFTLLTKYCIQLLLLGRLAVFQAIWWSSRQLDVMAAFMGKIVVFPTKLSSSQIVIEINTFRSKWSILGAINLRIEDGITILWIYTTPKSPIPRYPWLGLKNAAY